MTDMRQCDICKVIRPLGAPWWFVTAGKSKPSDWQIAKHWCDDCMKAALEHFTALGL